MSIGVGFGPWGLKLNTSMAGRGGVVPDNRILYSTFTATDGTPVNGHVPEISDVGATWALVGIFGAGYTISGNTASPLSGAVTTGNIIEMGTADRDITFNIIMQINSGGTFVFFPGIRSNAAGTQRIVLRINATQMQLAVGGGATFATVALPAWAFGEAHTLRCYMLGNHYLIYWDGALLIDYTDGTNTFITNPYLAVGGSFETIGVQVDTVSAVPT